MLFKDLNDSLNHVIVTVVRDTMPNYRTHIHGNCMFYVHKMDHKTSI